MSSSGAASAVELGGSPSEGISEAFDWDSLPRRVRFAIGKDGALPSPAVLATLFSGESDISSFLEKLGYIAGSVEWISSLNILVHLAGSSEASAGRVWRARAMRGYTHVHSLTPSLQDQLQAAPPTQEWLSSKSGAKRLLLRWPTRRDKDLALATEPHSRARVEATELARWRRQLVAVLKECKLPVCHHAIFAADPEKVLMTSSGNLRASTLRSRMREWAKFSSWCLATEGKPFPGHVGLLLDYIEELREQPCARTRLRSVLSAVAVVEKAGGIQREAAISLQPLVLNLVNVRTAELEVGAPPTRRAVPLPICVVMSLELTVSSNDFPRYLRAFAWIKLFKFWTSSRSDDLQGASFDSMVLSESGLRGHFDRTKTSGAGRKVRFLPFFISSEAWLVSRRWLELGFRIWKGSEFSFKRDFLVPRPTRNLQGCRPVLPSYNDLATASRMVLSLLRAPAYYEGDWFLTDELLLGESGVLRVFTEHSERSCMSTLAAWAGIDRERRDYLGRWHIVESADVYVRSAWRVVSSLQMYLVNALLETAELRKVGLSEVQERLQDNGLGADDARALCEGLQAPSDWASWRSVHITARPPLPHVDKPAPEPAPVQESKGYKFYVSVLGKRSLRRLHRKGGCGTKPEDLIKCEFYETIEGVEFDAECKHCFKPEPAAASSAEGAEPSDEGSSSTSLEDAASASDSS